MVKVIDLDEDPDNRDWLHGYDDDDESPTRKKEQSMDKKLNLLKDDIVNVVKKFTEEEEPEREFNKGSFRRAQKERLGSMDLQKFNENHDPGTGQFASGGGGGGGESDKSSDLRRQAVYLSKKIGQLKDEEKMYRVKDPTKAKKMQSEIASLQKQLHKIHQEEGVVNKTETLENMKSEILDLITTRKSE